MSPRYKSIGKPTPGKIESEDDDPLLFVLAKRDGCAVHAQKQVPQTCLWIYFELNWQKYALERSWDRLLLFLSRINTLKQFLETSSHSVDTLYWDTHHSCQTSMMCISKMLRASLNQISCLQSVGKQKDKKPTWSPQKQILFIKIYWFVHLCNTGQCSLHINVPYNYYKYTHLHHHWHMLRLLLSAISTAMLSVALVVLGLVNVQPSHMDQMWTRCGPEAALQFSRQQWSKCSQAAGEFKTLSGSVQVRMSPVHVHARAYSRLCTPRRK